MLAGQSALAQLPVPDARALLPRIAAAYQSITDYRAGVDIEISEMPSQDPKTGIRLLLAGSKPGASSAINRL